MAFKTFAPGVLSSSDMNTFLMRQAVITCTAATRPASPNEGMLIYETDTKVFSSYNGSAWVDVPSLPAATNPQTGSGASAYTFVLADALRLTTASNAAAGTYTIPPQGSVAWLANSVIRIVNYGAGIVTIAGGAGVTVTNSTTTLSQYDSADLIRTGSNAWTLVPFWGKTSLALTFNAKTSAYTLLLSDAGQIVTMDSGSAQTVTIPSNGTAAFPTGSVVGVAALGTGVVTIAGAGGVTVNSTAGTAPRLSARYAGAQCYKTATDTWLVIGSIV